MSIRLSLSALMLAFTVVLSASGAQSSLTFAPAGDVPFNMAKENDRVTIGRFVCPANQGGKTRDVDVQWLAFEKLQLQVQPSTTWKAVASVPRDSFGVTHLAVRGTWDGGSNRMSVVMTYTDKKGSQRNVATVTIPAVNCS
jgi:hypothetical protein